MAYLFVGSVFVFIGFCLLRSISLVLGMMAASTSLHHKMSEVVIRARVLFFDSNPIGRITTRFSKDMSILDAMIPNILIFAT